MPEHAAGRLPHLVIIGAPKCATTAMARWLAIPGDTFVPDQKELRFLDQHWDRGSAWYEQAFAGARSDQVRLEATPSYLAHEEAPARAAQIGLDRFAVMLRDPIERAWSHHWFRQAWGPGLDRIARPFEEIVREEIAAGFPPNGILTHSRYAHHIGRWRRENPGASLLAVDYQQVADDPAAAFHRVRDFAGLPRVAPPPEVGSSHNVGIRVRWPRVRAIFFRYRLWARLPGSIGVRLDELNQQRRPPLSVTDEVLDELEELFAPDVAMMRQLTAEPPCGN